MGSNFNLHLFLVKFLKSAFWFLDYGLVILSKLYFIKAIMKVMKRMSMYFVCYYEFNKGNAAKKCGEC